MIILLARSTKNIYKGVRLLLTLVIAQTVFWRICQERTIIILRTMYSVRSCCDNSMGTVYKIIGLLCVHVLIYIPWVARKGLVQFGVCIWT